MTDNVADLQARIAAENEESVAKFGRAIVWLIFLTGVGLVVWSFFIPVTHSLWTSGADYKPGAEFMGIQTDVDDVIHAVMTCLAGVGLMITGAIFISARRRP